MIEFVTIGSEEIANELPGFRADGAHVRLGLMMSRVLCEECFSRVRLGPWTIGDLLAANGDLLRQGNACHFEDGGKPIKIRPLAFGNVWRGRWRFCENPMTVAFVPDAVVTHAVAMIGGEDHHGVVT